MTFRGRARMSRSGRGDGLVRRVFGEDPLQKAPPSVVEARRQQVLDNRGRGQRVLDRVPKVFPQIAGHGPRPRHARQERNYPPDVHAQRVPEDGRRGRADLKDARDPTRAKDAEHFRERRWLVEVAKGIAEACEVEL
jgi:hypothetical protein